MTKKTLIINGSPRVHGDTAALIAELRKYLEGEVVEVSAFRAKIAPCVDCRRCWTTAECAIKDEMQILYNDDYDNIVLASPVYFSTLPGSVLSLMSRFQPLHAKMYFLNQKWNLRPKKAGLILTAGSRKNEDGAIRHARTLFKLTNAKGFEEHIVKSLLTDTIPAAQDEKALADARELAKWLNEE